MRQALCAAVLLTLAALRATWRDSGLQIPLVLFLAVIAEAGFAWGLPSDPVGYLLFPRGFTPAGYGA